MPSDYLSESEKRKMNGNIDTINTNEPMPWERFKNLPLTLQKEYAKENPTVVNESEAEHTSDVDSWAFTFRDVNDMKDILMLIRNLPLPRNAMVHISVYDGKDGEI